MNPNRKIEIKEKSTTIVVFGAVGDLSTQKLIPALFDLYEKDFLPHLFQVIGFSRGARSDADFREYARDAIITRGHKHDPANIERFVKNFHYHAGFFEDSGAYLSLGEELIAFDERLKTCSNKLFYLAVPPASYETILSNLADSGLTIPCSDTKGWTRVLIEKPFGEDIVAAQKLDKLLGLLFREEQIFRIDHYLAKETIQNILSFRFSNILFEPIWNRDYIEKISIRLFETGGVDRRGDFYDGIGAIRDVGQNHALQMLSAIAMENPRVLDPDRIRAGRADVLSSLVPITNNTIKNQVVRGQYKGYTKIRGVAKDSQTETYFNVQVFLRNKRWKGVPFYLEGGKKMGTKKAEISVYFKKTESCLCHPESEQHHQNVLTFRIQPDEGISVVFWAKRPGLGAELDPKMLTFLYKDDVMGSVDAYEKVLYDAIFGDQTLFTSTDEVLSAWKFITPVLKYINEVPLKIYEEGFEGAP